MTGFIVVYARLEWAAAFSPCSEFSMALAILVFLSYYLRRLSAGAAVFLLISGVPSYYLRRLSAGAVVFFLIFGVLLLAAALCGGGCTPPPLPDHRGAQLLLAADLCGRGGLLLLPDHPGATACGGSLRVRRSSSSS